MALKHGKRHAVARRPKRKSHARPRKGLGHLGQMARIQETVEFQDITADRVQGLNFSLFQFRRASTLAVNFRWYKAAKVVWTIDPIFNLFAEGGPGSPGMPYIYNRMNRTQDGFNYTIANLQAMGAKPVKFNRQIKYTYKPNWCSPGLLTYQVDQSTSNLRQIIQQGLQSQYGWLNSPGALPTGTADTDIQQQLMQGNVKPPPFPNLAGINGTETNSCLYNGNDIFIDQLNPQNGVTIARVTCTVHWEFKDPNFQNVTVGDLLNAPAPVTAKSVGNDIITA